MSYPNDPFQFDYNQPFDPTGSYDPTEDPNYLSPYPKKKRSDQIFGGYSVSQQPIVPGPSTSTPDTPPPPPTTPQQPHETEEDYINRTMKSLSQWYHPQTTASDRANDLLWNMPQDPGRTWKDALLGVSMAAGGSKPEEVFKQMDKPYDDKVAEWKMQVEPALRAASEERQSNANERTLMGNLITGQSAAYRTQQQAIKDENARVAAAEKNRITESNNQMRNDVARMRRIADQTGVTYDLSGPYVIAHAKDGTIYNTGMETGKMDEMSKIELQNTSKVEAATALGASRAAIAAAKDKFYQDSKGNLYKATATGLEPQGNAPPMPEGQLNEVGTKRENTPPAGGTENQPVRLTEEQEYDRKKAIYDANPDIQPWFDEYLRLKDAPKRSDYGIMGYGGQSTYDQKMKEWQHARDTMGPGQTGIKPGQSGQTNNQTGKRADDTTLQDGASPKPTKLFRSKSNPKEVRADLDNGQTVYSHDGGQTWGAQ